MSPPHRKARATLSASQHGGVTIHVEVADTNLALISEDGAAVGQKSLDVFIPDGSTYASYYVHGKEETTGTVVITGTAPGFTTGVDSILLVVPKVRITNSIAGTQDTLDPPDNFATSVGVANTVNFFTQYVRPGSPGVVMTATLASRLGKDLQSVAASAELGEPNHGGITVHVEVSDSTLGLVSNNALVAGERFIDIPLSNGDAEALFYLQALDTGMVTVTATANTFAAAMHVVDVVPAGTRIIQLADTMATTDPNDEFIVQVGAVNGDNTDIEEPQPLRGGGPSRTLSIASSDGNLAFIVLGTNLGETRDYVLDPGDQDMPAGRAAVQWQGLDDRGNRVASGVYFYRLRSGSMVKTRKMVLLK